MAALSPKAQSQNVYACRTSNGQRRRYTTFGMVYERCFGIDHVEEMDRNEYGRLSANFGVRPGEVGGESKNKLDRNARTPFLIRPRFTSNQISNS
jgi:hypothetical protein